MLRLPDATQCGIRVLVERSFVTFEEEPVSADNPLLNLPNVVVSSHMAGVTAETGRAMAMQVTAEMLRVLRGEKPDVLGNPDLWPKLAHLP